MRPEIKTQLIDFLNRIRPTTEDKPLWYYIISYITSKTGSYPPYVDQSLAPTPYTLESMYRIHSGKKYVNQAIIEEIDRYGGATPEEMCSYVTLYIVPQNYQNWERRWNALQQEYNPLNNYDMIEQGDDQITRNETETGASSRTEESNRHSVGSETEDRDTEDTINRSGVESRSVNETMTGNKDITSSAKTSGQNSAEQYIVPFNTGHSDVANGSSAGTQSVTGNSGNEKNDENREHAESADHSETESNKLTESGTRGTTATDTGKVSGSEDRSATRSGTDRTEHTLTRSGNIGVTTSQQMLQAELDLRVYDFYESIFADVDKILCERVYSLE